MAKRFAPLTDIQVRTVKVQDREFKLFDGGGLFLLVTLSGGKLWRFKYRCADKEKKLTFGAYPHFMINEVMQLACYDHLHKC